MQTTTINQEAQQTAERNAAKMQGYTFEAAKTPGLFWIFNPEGVKYLTNPVTGYCDCPSPRSTASANIASALPRACGPTPKPPSGSMWRPTATPGSETNGEGTANPPPFTPERTHRR